MTLSCPTRRSSEHQPRFARLEIVAPTLRYHESQRADVPGATFEFDELPARQVIGDEVSRPVPPATTGLEQVALGAEVLDQPLARAGHALLGLFRLGPLVRDDAPALQAPTLQGVVVRCPNQPRGWCARGPP